MPGLGRRMITIFDFTAILALWPNTLKILVRQLVPMKDQDGWVG